MQKLYRLFCAMNFTLPQSYHISQLLIIGHDCLVPEDKHGSVKIFIPPLCVKGLMFEFHSQLSIFFTQILHVGRRAIDMKHSR